jgi:hypothetical protein
MTILPGTPIYDLEHITKRLHPPLKSDLLYFRFPLKLYLCI